MYKLILVILSGCMIVPTSQARWLTPKESGSVIEKFLVTVDVQKSGAATESVDYAIRVQSEDAKSTASIFTIEYNSSTDKVEILEAYTLNGNQRINVESDAIEDRDKGEAKDYDAVKVRSVVFPHVQIGSRLFIKYKQVTKTPMIQDRWSDQYSVTPGTFVEKFELTVNSDSRPLYYSKQDPMDLVTVKQKDPRHIFVHNKKILPGWVTAEKDPYFHPDSTTEIWVSTEKNWTDFLSGLNAEFEKVQSAGVPKPLQAWVQEAARKKNAEDQITFLMEKMSHDFRYFGDWRRHNGGVIPRPLKEIEQSRYGDCKDLASLLTSLLRALKLEANVALVRRGENPWGSEPDYTTPVAARFNHAIVQVVLPDHRKVWLDATNPVASLKAFPDISGRPAYVLDPKGAHFDRLAEALPSDFQHVHNYEYRFQAEDVVGVKVNAVLKDLAPYHIANELMMSPRSEVLTSTLDYFSEGQEVKKYRYLREPKTERLLSDMILAIDFDAGRVTYNAGKGSFFVIPDGFLSNGFFETNDRASDLKLGDEPYSFKGSRRLKYTRLAQEVPASCRVDSDWMMIERSVQVEGHDVVIHQAVDLKKPFVRRAEFMSAPFKKFQEDSKRCFYHSGIMIEPFKG